MPSTATTSNTSVRRVTKKDPIKVMCVQCRHGVLKEIAHAVSWRTGKLRYLCPECVTTMWTASQTNGK